ncbi:hypothetical protein OH77DRAFT_1586942 [Trametes cingulata]|nr:hypothetical protein OH77DRAFT_1586942 [Trametes cingulata]
MQTTGAKLTSDDREVFASIFKDGKNARHDVPWQAFQLAMEHFGFTIKSGDGSHWVFTPPAAWGAKMITFHQPHGTRMINARIQDRFAKRLRRQYRWTAGTFRAKK